MQVVVFLALISPLGWGAPVALQDLLRIAETQQVDWRQASANLSKAKEGLTLRRSKFLPSLGLASSFNYDNQTTIVDNENVTSSAFLQSTWSLYDNGTSFRNYRISALELKKAEADQTVARDKVSFEILSRYTQHLLVRRQREITERKLLMLQNQYRTTERQFRQGLKTVRDYQRLQTDLERARLSLLRLDDQTRDTFEELQRYLGRPDLLSSPEQLAIVKAADLLSLFLQKTSNFAFAAEQVPEVKSAGYTAETLKIKVREAAAPLWPTVNLSASAGYGSDGFTQPGERWQDNERFFTNGQLKLAWTLFDWGGNHSQYRAAIIDESLADLNFRQAKVNAQTNFSRELRQAERQKKSLLVTRSIFEIERKTYLNIESEYRDGRAAYLDLINSLDRQAQAEIDLEQETTSYALVLAESLKLMGGLYESLAK